MGDQLQTDSLPQIRDIDGIISNTAKIKRLNETLQYNIKQTALSMESHLNEDGKTDLKKQFEQIDKAFLTTLALNEQLSKYSKGAEDLKNYVYNELRNLNANRQSQESTDQIGSGENLADKYLGDYKNQLQIDKFSRSKEFREFKREISQVNGTENTGGDTELGEDEDLAIASQSINIYCPITTSILKEPYKSLVCNHVFSKDAIFQMFLRQSSIRCPVAGCNKTIQKNQIVAYPTFEVVIKKEIRRKEKAERERQTQEDILDV